MKTLKRLLVLALCLSFAVAASIAVLDLPPPDDVLASRVQSELANSGVRHAVTAVLLNFRGYDTLLEIGVLLLALLGTLTAGGEDTSSRRIHGAPHGFLQSLARYLAPLMIVVAGYLLWAGAYRPGGAFQAAAVLAAGVVLLFLAGLTPPVDVAAMLSRAGAVGGFMVFLAVAAVPLSYGSLLQYPYGMAGGLILLVEAGLTLSLGLLLAGLFVWQPDEHEEHEEAGE